MRLLIVATLILLTVQGWFGDSVNIFLIPSSPPTVERSANGVFQAIVNIGPTLVIHAFIGIAILAFAIVVLAFSLRSKPRNVQIPAILGLAMVVSAIIGGILFVLSGFSSGGVSAQLGRKLHRCLRILLHRALLRQVVKKASTSGSSAGVSAHPQVDVGIGG